ncbi:MAG: lipid-A-disaccharide synthase [Flavobacteriales bacterium]
MKLYLIAGEASGDLHGANLIKALRKQAPETDFRAWGGDLMSEAGADVVKHYRDLAFMGFIEVLLNLRTIFGNLRFCKNDIAQYKPDAVVLIDYPGFNLRIATWCREQGIPVLYYISPQIWAWKEGRIKRIKCDVTNMFVILPFEKDFYANHGMDVDFVGHPLLDVIGSSAQAKKEKSTRPRIALLPGSRKQEIKTMLPVMLEVIQQRGDCDFVIAGAPGQTAEFYHEVTGRTDLPLVFGRTYALFGECDAALVTSGTATLEAALHGIPLAVCYKGSAVSYAIAKRIVNIRFISLVNLILDREAVTELIQRNMNPERLAHELEQILCDEQKRQSQFAAFAELREMLGGAGASERAAAGMLKTLRTVQRDRTVAR